VEATPEAAVPVPSIDFIYLVCLKALGVADSDPFIGKPVPGPVGDLY